MSKTEIRYFTPLIDSVVEEYGLVTAAVLGAALRFCQMEDEVCNAAQEKIARRLSLSRATVNHHLGILVDAGFLKDLTPEVRNRPHTYTDTGKANFRVVVEAVVEDGGVKEIDTSPAKKPGGVKEIDTGCQGDLHPGVKQIDKKKDSLRNSSRNKEEDPGETIPSPQTAALDPTPPEGEVPAAIVIPGDCGPDPDEMLKAAKAQLAYSMQKGAYDLYVEPLKLVGWTDGVFRVSASNRFARDWVISRLGREFDRYLTGFAQREVHLEVQVRGSP